MNMTTRLELRPIESLKPYAKNARTHSPAQIKQLRKSLQEFGFVSPVLITAAGRDEAGRGDEKWQLSEREREIVRGFANA